MSEQNLEYAKQVKEAVGNIRITSEKMKIEEYKYLDVQNDCYKFIENYTKKRLNC